MNMNNITHYLDGEFEALFDREDQKRSKDALMHREERKLFRDNVRAPRTSYRPQRSIKLSPAMEL